MKGLSAKRKSQTDFGVAVVSFTHFITYVSRNIAGASFVCVWPFDHPY